MTMLWRPETAHGTKIMKHVQLHYLRTKANLADDACRIGNSGFSVCGTRVHTTEAYSKDAPTRE